MDPIVIGLIAIGVAAGAVLLRNIALAIPVVAQTLCEMRDRNNGLH